MPLQEQLGWVLHVLPSASSVGGEGLLLQKGSPSAASTATRVALRLLPNALPARQGAKTAFRQSAPAGLPNSCCSSAGTPASITPCSHQPPSPTLLRRPAQRRLVLRPRGPDGGVLLRPAARRRRRRRSQQQRLGGLVAPRPAARRRRRQQQLGGCLCLLRPAATRQLDERQQLGGGWLPPAGTPPRGLFGRSRPPA